MDDHIDKGWRKVIVIVVGILALCYGVYPAIGAIDGQTWFYGLLALTGGYGAANLYLKKNKKKE